jgi:hypothetical protein
MGHTWERKEEVEKVPYKENWVCSSCGSETSTMAGYFPDPDMLVRVKHTSSVFDLLLGRNLVPCEERVVSIAMET